MASTTTNKGAGSYFGGKGGSGTYQTIINQICPHHTYIEPFLGGGSIMQYKKKAEVNIGIDLDEKVIQSWIRKKDSDIQLNTICGIKYLEGLTYNGIRNKTVVYCDPPYPLSSRKSRKAVYKHELTDADHERLLHIIRKLDCDVLISTYPNELYAKLLKDWKCVVYQSTTRQGPATELLYMNYRNEEGLLHDYSFIGENYRERERIKKKIDRHVSRLQELPAPERNAILYHLTTSCSTAIITDASGSHSGTTNNDGMVLNKFIFNAYGVCENPEVVYEFENKKFSISLKVASDNGKFWGYGYSLKLKFGTSSGSCGGASLNRARCLKKKDAIVAAGELTRQWISRVVKENKITVEAFRDFYDWFSQQNQLDITDQVEKEEEKKPVDNQHWETMANPIKNDDEAPALLEPAYVKQYDRWRKKYQWDSVEWTQQQINDFKNLTEGEKKTPIPHMIPVYKGCQLLFIDWLKVLNKEMSLQDFNKKYPDGPINATDKN